MPAPKKNYARVTVWGATGTRMDTDGGTVGVMGLMFYMLTPEQRTRALEAMRKTDAELTAKEAAPAAA